MPMRNMLHTVECDDCDFLFEETGKMPSENWLEAANHDRETGHDTRLGHYPV